MSKHAERTSFVKTLSRGQWAKIAAAVAAVGLIATAGVISRDFYQSSTATPSITQPHSPPPTAQLPARPPVVRSRAPLM